MVWAWSQDYHREGQRHTILWDMPIHTDKTIAANRPDIVLTNKKDKTCLLIDMTIPLDTNTSVKTTEKLTKYKDLIGNRSWANVRAQNNNSPGGYGSPWHHQEGHRKLHQLKTLPTSTNMNSPFYSPPFQSDGPVLSTK